LKTLQERIAGAIERGGGGEYLQERRQTHQDGAGGYPGDQRAFDSGGSDAGSLALNIDLASVMQAGRWKSHRMPMRYGEHVLAGLGGMARAAKEQGRDRE
jgi:hypothetical protein